MNSPLRFAITGCGTISPTHADAILSLDSDTARLTHCADIDPVKARSFSERYGLKAVPFTELLQNPDIDAISICAPSGVHAELGATALRAGKDVIVEKPMDISLAACDHLDSAAKQSGRCLSVISQHRFDPASLRAQALIDSGRLGDLILIDARICWYRTQEYYNSAGWRGTWKMDGGGCLMNQGVHTVDLMRWLAGPVETVYAQTRTAGHNGIEVEDIVAATLTFTNGAAGTIMATTAAYPGFPARLALHGTRGSVVIEGDALQTVAIMGEEPEHPESAARSAICVAGGGTRSVVDNPFPVETNSLAPEWGQAHAAQLLDFVRCCRTGERPVVDAEGAREAVAVVLAVYESARTGCVVRMEDLAGYRRAEK